MDQNEIGSSLEDELSEVHQDSMVIEVEVSKSETSEQPKNRGRPAIPNKWVQVMSLDKDYPPKMVIQEISTGIKLAQAEDRVPNPRREKTWEPHFCPRKFCNDHPEMQFEQFKLSENNLKNYGITITKLRRRFQKEAMVAADPELYPNVMAEQEIKALSKIIKQRGEVKDIKNEMSSLPDFKEVIPIGMRRKSKRRGQLSLQEKVSIAHQVLVQFHHQKDVAKEYRVG